MGSNSPTKTITRSTMGQKRCWDWPVSSKLEISHPKCENDRPHRGFSSKAMIEERRLSWTQRESPVDSLRSYGPQSAVRGPKWVFVSNSCLELNCSVIHSSRSRKCHVWKCPKRPMDGSNWEHQNIFEYIGKSNILSYSIQLRVIVIEWWRLIDPQALRIPPRTWGMANASPGASNLAISQKWCLKA